MLITALLLAGYMQTEALLNGPVPADVPTFKVTLGSGPDFYAGIRINGAWVMDHTHEIKATQVVEFVPDDPFYTGTLNRTMMRNAVVSYEIPAMRKNVWKSFGQATATSFSAPAPAYVRLRSKMLRWQKLPEKWPLPFRRSKALQKQINPRQLMKCPRSIRKMHSAPLYCGSQEFALL